MDRPKFSDIVRASGKTSLAQKWNSTVAAGEYVLLKRGEYNATISEGVSHNAKSGNFSYRLKFTITDDPFKGRHLTYDLWFSDAALPQTKRDLAKLGVPVEDYTAMEEWLNTKPLPPDLIQCKIKVIIERGDDGNEYNRVRSFTVVCINEPPVNHFAPPPAEAVVTPAPTAEPAPEPADPPAPAPKRRGRPPKQPVEANGVAGVNGVAHDGRRF